MPVSRGVAENVPLTAAQSLDRRPGDGAAPAPEGGLGPPSDHLGPSMGFPVAAPMPARSMSRRSRCARIRYESPLIESRVARYRNRSRIAAAIMESEKISPHEAMVLLLVTIIAPASALRDTTWKMAAAPSAWSGKYPSSSQIRSCGPAKNRIVVAHRPSIAALWHRATRSAAVV